MRLPAPALILRNTSLYVGDTETVIKRVDHQILVPHLTDECISSVHGERLQPQLSLSQMSP